MSPEERKILKTLQNDFPLSARPYRELARRLGLEEGKLIAGIRELRRRGYIRRIGASVCGRKAGYKSVLAGARVEKKYLRAVTARINLMPEVSHNYLRSGRYNLWWTLSAKTKPRLAAVIRRLRKEKGISRIMVLPAQKVFKINARFAF